MLYELSVPISCGTIRYDESIPAPRFRPFTSIQAGDINNQTEFSLFAHLGSHVDAPYHFCETGKKIDEYEIDSFIFRKALLLDVETRKGVSDADILLLYTGYSKYCFNETVYRDDFPALTKEAAVYIREELPNLKAIALDTMSADGTDGVHTNFANHHVLLDTRDDGVRALLIYENMDFTPVLGTKGFFSVYGIPLRLRGIEASPVTMVAEI